MDSKRQRTISDIRPARSMDGMGVRPTVGVARPQKPEVPKLPTESAPSVVSAPVAPAVPAPIVEPKLPPATKVVTAEPVKAVTEEKPKKSKLKVLIKIVLGLIVVGLLAAGGWVVYVNYFK